MRDSFVVRPHLAAPMLVLLLLAVLLRWPGMQESLWYDELSSTRMYLGDVSLYFNRLLTLSHMPTHYTLTFFWIKLFGDSEISIRFPSLLFGLGSIGLAHAIAVPLFGRRVALLTAFLLCVSPVHIWYSSEARPYSGVIFFSLLAVFSFLKRTRNRASTGWYVGYGLSLAAAVFAHLYLVILPVLMLLYGLLASRRVDLRLAAIDVCVISAFAVLLMLKEPGVRFGSPGLLLILLALPVAFFVAVRFLAKLESVKARALVIAALAAGSVLALLPQFGAAIDSLRWEDHQYLRPFTLFAWWKLFFNWYPSGGAIWSSPDLDSLGRAPFALATQVCLFLALGLGAVRTVGRAFASREWGGLLIVAILFAFPAALYLLSFLGFRGSYVERSAIAGLPFFLMLIANGLCGVQSTPRRNAAIALLIVFSGFAVLQLFRKDDVWTVYKPNPDWRSATHYMSRQFHRHGGDIAILSETTAVTLTYYDPRLAYPGVELRRKRRIDQYFVWLKQAYGEAGGLVDSLHRAVAIDAVRGATTPRLFVGPAVHRKLGAVKQRASFLYFIENQHWPGDSARSLSALLADPELVLVDRRAYPGIRIHRFRTKRRGSG